MSNIFISYRRSDSIASAGRIRDRLVQHFGRKRVFVDIDDIPYGQDFVKVLEGKVAECGVLLAIIGPEWLGAVDAQGQSRLNDTEDFVGIEIRSALQRPSVTIIPVLVDGAKMPLASQLPDALKPLARRNAIELRNTQFGSDAERLINSINIALEGRTPLPMGRILGGVGAALLALGAVIGWPYFQPTKPTAKIDPPAKPADPAIWASPATLAPPPPQSGRASRRDIADGLQRLEQAMKPAQGRLDLKIAGGSQISIGKDVVFQVTTKTAGRLIVVDINAANEVIQIFPNSFVTNELAELVPAGKTITVPGLGYGFSAFRAAEPAGNGVLIAIMQPASSRTLPSSREQMTKGFEPVQSPAGFLAQLVTHVSAGLASNDAGTVGEWAYARVDYSIVR